MKINPVTLISVKPINENPLSTGAGQASLVPSSSQSVASALRGVTDIVINGLLPDMRGIKLIGLQPQGAAHMMASSVGQRDLSLCQFENGIVQLELSRPPLRGLVLAGGGAKGVAYPGAVKALEEKGALKEIRTISGSSAGGITAALLASGMKAAEFKELSDSMNLISLMDSTHSNTNFYQNICSAMGEVSQRTLPKIGSFTQLLLNILPRIQSEALPLENVIHEETSKSMLSHIYAHPETARIPPVADVQRKLEQGGFVTFGDLAMLSRFVPEIKELNITGTAMFEHRPQMVVFNASLTPEMSIARAAHISSSFPVVFQPVDEQSQPFQAAGEHTKFKDGGIMLNVPVPELIDRSFSNSPLRKADNLILEFEKGAAEAPDRGGRFRGAMTDWVVGAPVAARLALQNEALKAHEDQVVTIPLRTEEGDFSTTLGGTLNFTMSEENKNYLQERLEDVVSEHLDNRVHVREQHLFETIEDALHALDDEMLEGLQAANPEIKAGEVLLFRQKVRDAFTDLTVAINTQNENNEKLHINEKIFTILDRLDILSTNIQKKNWIAKELNQEDNREYQQLLSAGSGLAVKLSVLNAAIDEMKMRNVAVVCENIRKEIIFPSLYRAGQPDSNVALLRHVEHNLSKATSPAQVNEALNELIDNYKARNKPWKEVAKSSTTIEMAKAWLKKE